MSNVTNAIPPADDVKPRPLEGTVAADPSAAGAPTPESPARSFRWWNTASPFVMAGGLLGIFHGVFLAWRYQSVSGNSEMFIRLTALGFMVGLLTMLVLWPAGLLLRRLHPAWKRGWSSRATWPVALGMATAVASWMAADRWMVGQLLPDAADPLAETAVALGLGFLAACLPPPPKRWIQVGAAVILTLVALPCIGLIVASASSASADATASGPVGHRADGDRPDVVLISVDTLRADRLGVYGHSPSLTPAIDRFAQEGVLFRRAVASSPWTLPSIASLLTGLPTMRHGAGLPLGPGPSFLRSPLSDGHQTLAERLGSAGYRTRAVVANAFLSAELGVAQGFEEYRNPLLQSTQAGVLRELPLPRLLLSFLAAEKVADPRAEGITDVALEWLAEPADEPLFLWIHYIDTHAPFRADPEGLEIISPIDEIDAEARVHADGTVVGDRFAAVHQVRSGLIWLGEEDRRRIVDYYDRSVRYVDHHLGRLFEALRQRSKTRDVVAVLTADHGEEFWDHGGFEHGHDYYSEVTQVPLIFWGPRRIPAARKVDGTAGLVDVVPTLLNLAEVEAPEPEDPAEGMSLVDLWNGAPIAARPPRFSTGNLYDLPAAMVEDGPWRYILRANQREELYNLDLDPEESRNLAHDEPDVAMRYRELVEPRLADFVANQNVSDTQLSPETVNGLKSLGYTN